MPPAAISRSSTYLPKICGNIWAKYGSAPAGFVLALGCSEPDPAPLSIRLETLSRCPLPEDSGRLELRALGDFDAGNDTVEALSLEARGAVLAFPAETRALEARIGPDEQRFLALGERRQDAIAALLLPELESCALHRPASDAYPSSTTGQALGVAESSQTLLVAGSDGGDDGDNALSFAVSALSVDLATGSVERIDEPARAMAEPRADATVTPFGEKLLVAGGRAPPSLDHATHESAELFDPALSSFERIAIELRQARSRHGAAVLPNGDTLLIAGRGEQGDALRSLEVISLETQSSSFADVIQLAVGRIDPVVLRLTDGRLLIAGGTSSEPESEPVRALEWLSADASERAREPLLEPPFPERFGRAFVAMPGGGALAVGGCEARAPQNEDEAELCGTVCERGCPPESGAEEAWWISPQGDAQPVELSVPAPRPILIASSDAAPWLITSGLDPDSAEPSLLRFNPWRGRFESAERAPSRLPDPKDPRLVELDRGAFAWLDAGGLHALRFDTRGAFAQDLPLVIQTHPLDPLAPLHLAPDRAPLAGGAAFDGRLRLGFATVFVTDATYDSVRIELEVTRGPPPIVVLGELELGGPICAWPGSAVDAARETLVVTRRDAEVTLERDDERHRCTFSEGRVSVGVKGGGRDETVLERLVLERDF